MNDLCFEITTAAAGSSAAVTNAAGEQLRSFEEMALKSRATFSPATHTGIAVNEQTAMRLASVYASIRIIAETIGSLPAQVFERNSAGHLAQTHSHPVAELIGVQPNEDQTPLVFCETTMQHVLGHGNSFAAINWSTRNGDPLELQHFHPTEVEVGRDRDTGRLMYRVASDSTNRVFDASEMLHVPGFGNGILGYSPVRYFAQAIGLGLAQERFAGLYFGKGAKPNLIVETPGNLSDEGFDSLKSAIDDGFSGDRAFGALLLEGGAKATAVSIPMNEAQLLESRNFSGRDISQRMFRIPPHISGYTDALKYDQVEQADLQFAKHCLGPWLVRREQEFRRKLFRPGERGRFEIRHNLDALLRADLKTRYEAHKTAILSAFGTINERRALENLPPVEGGDRIIMAESVFGQQAGGRTPDDEGDNSNSGSRSERGTESEGKATNLVRRLLLQQLEGLLHREAVHAERHFGKSDWSKRTGEFYEKHRQLIEERLEVLEVDLGPAIANLIGRADELATIGDTGGTAGDIADLFTRHAEMLEPLVDRLLETETETERPTDG